MNNSSKKGSMAMVLAKQQEEVGSRGIVLHSFEDLKRFCSASAASGYFKDAQDVAKAIVKVQAGMELGVPPIASMAGIHIVEGKPTLSSGLIASRIKASGKYRFVVKKHTETECELEFKEKLDGSWESVGVASFTMADAAKAGIGGRTNWKRYPKNMLFARAISNGARWYCADIFTGAIYTTEEIQDDISIVSDDVQTEAVNVTPEVVAPKEEKVDPKKLKGAKAIKDALKKDSK
ncbi:MAG: putative recombination protein [Prokaryotic dsDNA virus sp.]|nr:MAG: putative recombination protein [Prokaryotic dsDNA virus sp.]|tara:strand:+ start:654 stop:1358 length:705 start_codon:yes stop_codon:yes gene_type:complete